MGWHLLFDVDLLPRIVFEAYFSRTWEPLSPSISPLDLHFQLQWHVFVLSPSSPVFLLFSFCAPSSLHATKEKCTPLSRYEEWWKNIWCSIFLNEFREFAFSFDSALGYSWSIFIHILHATNSQSFAWWRVSALKFRVFRSFWKILYQIENWYTIMKSFSWKEKRI